MSSSPRRALLLALGLVLLCPLTLATPASAERPLPDWERWEAARSVRRGEAALIRGDLDAAETLARRASELTPSEPVVWALLTRTLFAASEWERMSEAATRWVEAAPDSSAAALLAGRAALELGSGAQAAQHYSRAAELEPDLVQGQLGLALCAARSSDWTGMQAHLRDARRREPSLDLSGLPLSGGWEGLAGEPSFLEALNAVLAEVPPSESPHAETDAGAPDK